MSKYQATDYLKHYAFTLRAADHEAYKAFLEAFEAYTTEVTVAVTEAPADQILNMQGRAKQMRAVVELLRTSKPLPQAQQPAAS